jgi:putative oxidoreductase
VLAASAVAIAAMGAGKLSLDYALFHNTGFYDLLHGWWGLVISLAVGLAGGIAQLAIFYRPPVKA